MKVAERLRTWVRSVGRLRWRSPGMTRLLDAASAPLRRCHLRILSGAGRGLRFHAAGANAGYVLGTTEPEVQRAYELFVRPGHRVWDVGANVGFLATIAARLVGAGGRVICFEPLPGNRSVLRSNLGSNGFRDRTTVLDVALGANDGEARFLRSRVSGWGKLATLGREVAEPAGEIPVTVRRTDGLVAERPDWSPDVVKIDVEGAEVDVVDGAGHTLRTARPTLLIELHGTNAAIAERLHAANYRAHVLGEDSAIVASPWDAFVVAVPAECVERTRLLEQLP